MTPRRQTVWCRSSLSHFLTSKSNARVKQERIHVDSSSSFGVRGETNMEPELAAVLTINNRGVGLVANGEFQAALLLFRNALQRMRAVASQTTRQQDPQESNNNQELLVPPALKLTSVVPAAYDDEEDLVQLSCVAFNRGFTIGVAEPPQEEEEQRVDSPPAYELLVATIVYNTALAYDIRRKKNASTQLGSIEHATNHYEQALSLLQSMPSIDEDNLLLLLAAANNRAVLALEMGDYDTLEVYRSILQQLIRPSNFVERDFFACNLLSTASVRGRPAAAA
eukprot:scaffold5885_cov201-Amphora_coffeaeformis.AAC.18